MASITQANGHGSDPKPALSAADQQLDALLTPIVAVVMNGSFTTLQGVPPDRIMVSLARILGRSIGASCRGDLAGVLKLRGECKTAFNEALSAAPLAPAPGLPPQHPANQG